MLGLLILNFTLENFIDILFWGFILISLLKGVFWFMEITSNT
jgi:hypothetical protein